MGNSEGQMFIDSIRSVIPFRFIPMDRIAGFAGKCHEVAFADGTTIIRKGAADQDVYLLLEGRVEVLDGLAGGDRIFIESGHYFGEWEAIFDVPRARTIIARGPCRCMTFPGEALGELLDRETSFTQAMSGVLREMQGIFKAFELFTAEVVRGVGYGHISIQKLLPLYQDLEPAIHAHACDPGTLNHGAMDYAVRRLPANVTSTFAFLIRDELPAVYLEPGHFFPPVTTDARRRSIWEIMPGKDMVLVRSGMSDIMDLVTCLCLYATEAHKIRKTVYASRGVDILWQSLSEGGGGDPLSVLERAGLPQDWAAGILGIWPKDAVRRVWEMVNHREMFTVDVRTRQKSYNMKDFSKWSFQIGEACRSLYGCDPVDLPEDVEVHVLSSNTHSVANCLNPWYRHEAGRILEWAESVGHPHLSESWEVPHDLPYALVRDYFRSNPEAVQDMLGWETRSGIRRLEATASTGIEVQLIDLRPLAGVEVDPLVHVPADGKRRLLVNIDYAFGEQAEPIIHQLILLFGRNIRSVNFLGKAGSLAGKRGDILVPGAFIDQVRDIFMPVDLPSPAEDAGLQQLAPGRTLHHGPMLTVPGTLMQNREMLNFYRRLWKVAGIEMEGVYYHRQVQESIQTGLLPCLEASRFLYYVSDMPLDTGSNLSRKMQASEGIPPLYAITRHFLRLILGTVVPG